MKSKKRYPPSWVDRISDWVDSLPISAPAFFVALYAAFALIVHAAVWIEGRLPFGSFDSRIVADVIWAPFGLAFLYYLKRVSAASFDEFRPALADKEEIEELGYRFTTFPALPILLLSLAGFIGGVITALGVPFPYRSDAGYSAANLTWAVFSGGGYTFLPLWLYAAYRRIRQISDLYGRVKTVDLFNLQPLYGPSRVAMAIAFFFVVLINLNFVTEMFLGTRTLSDQGILITTLLSGFIAVAVFLLPLWGVHKKIDLGKRTLLAENGRHLEDLRKQLHSDLAKTNFDNVEGLERGLNALFSMRKNIESVPAWPWNPGAFRNFVSAVTLPLFIWLAQQFLSQYL